MFFSALTRRSVRTRTKEKARYAFRASGLDMSAYALIAMHPPTRSPGGDDGDGDRSA
jgi:hypothetical protein